MSEPEPLDDGPTASNRDASTNDPAGCTGFSDQILIMQWKAIVPQNTLAWLHFLVQGSPECHVSILR